MAKIPINLSSGSIDKKEEKSVIIGIDLGTTNSLVAIIQDGNPIALKGNESTTLVPSVIHFDDNSEQILVGNNAKQFIETKPERTIFSVKRLMGKSYEDIKKHAPFLGYKIIDQEDQLVKIEVDGKFYTPIELSSLILKELKYRVEKHLNQKVSKAVITVPAYFNDSQRQATRDAGKLAGLDVLRIINEPTAASLAYGIKEQDADQTIAVYDLGGGTFDISILQLNSGIFEVLSTNGDTFLGGDDFDKAIIDYWTAEYDFISETLSDNQKDFQELRLLAEKAKKTLSSEVTFISTFKNNSISIDQETFHRISKTLINKTLQCCKNAVKDAAIEITEIDKILLVGGSTRMPQVYEAVSQFFNQKADNSLHPDEVVALGAAIQADVLAGNNKDVLLLDITPLSLGIETVGNLMDVIIPRNSKIPTSAGRQYTTSVDGQANLKISIYQGERDVVTANRKLGEFILKGIPAMPAGFPKIEIKFMLNADGILNVSATELRSGVAQTIDIKPQYGLTDEEVETMLLDSLKNAEQDMKFRSLEEARNEANNIVLATEKFLLTNKNILSEVEINETKKLNDLLRISIKGNDKDLILKATDNLNVYTEPLAHRAMDVSIENAMKGKRV